MLEQIAKDYEVDLEELKKIETELKQKYQSIPNIGILKGTEDAFIKKGLISHAKRIKRNNAEQMFGFILTYEQPKSSNKGRITEAIKKYKEDPDNAVKSGYVMEIKEQDGKFHMRKLTKNGTIGMRVEPKLHEAAINTGETYIVPLDVRKVFAGGKANWRYLQSLDAEAYFSNIQGYVIIDIKTYKFKMPLNIDANNPINIPMNRPIKFRAALREIGKDGVYNLQYKNGITNFEIVEGNLEPFKQQISEFMPISEITKISEIHKSQYGDPIAVCGTVTDIWMKKSTDDQPAPSNTVMIEDLSVDIPIRTNFHHVIPIDFAIGSIVIIWGRTGKGDKWDKETRQTIKGEIEWSIWANGVYPLVRIGPDEPPKPVTAEGIKKEEEEWTT